MDSRELIDKLNEKIGGRVFDNRGVYSFGKDLGVSGLPGLVGTYKGFGVRADFLSPGELVLEVYVDKKPPHFLLVMHESVVSKFLDKIHLAAEVKIGVSEFDDKYKIQKATSQDAQVTLNPDFRSSLEQLEPFALFEITSRSYKVLKYIKPGFEYYSDKAIQDLETIIQLIEINQKTWSI